MSTLLQSLNLAPSRRGRVNLSGLVTVASDLLRPLSIAEKVARREAVLLKGSQETENIGIDYIFFRRFADSRSSQVAAYVIDNAKERYNEGQIAELHYRVWLSGSAPLLYVEWPTRVDVFKCAAEPLFWNDTKNRIDYVSSASIETASDVSRMLDERLARRFSGYRLSDGTFWDDPENSDWARADKAAHKSLIQAVIEADDRLAGAENPLMRRLLLLFILAKYLDDRGVFPAKWFSRFYEGASSFLDVLSSGKTTAVQKLLNTLKEKFNGDIFDISVGIDESLTRETLTHFTTLLEARTLKRQMFLWKQFSFNFIPVEVLSHMYQHFAQKGAGAVFTPPFVADLMLDHAMPYDRMTGNERVFDPTCGSGIFLVGAFRRIVHHWQDRNQWKRPSVRHLKKMLRSSIFGAEVDPNSAQVAAFNLALAVCDALQPRVIWRDLKFDRLIGRNILVGDLFANLGGVRDVSPEGFTIILGNPPFMSKLTSAAQHTRETEDRTVAIPDQQMSYRIAEQAMLLLSSDGRMCLIQTAGFLYNANARRFLVHFTSRNTIEAVLDFASIRGLFEHADAKTVAIVARRGTPNLAHRIVHYTFRRTKSVHDEIGFELDHYDRHVVSQESITTHPWIWKANLLGGGRLVALGQKARGLENLKEYFQRRGWDYGEGYIAARSGRRTAASWLTGQSYLPTENLQSNGVVGGTAVVAAKEFRSAYTPKRYTGPIIMIRANEQLPSTYRSSGFLAYKDKIIGISADAADEKRLKGFWEFLSEHKAVVRFLIYLFSTQMLLNKSTAFLKRDFDELPSPESGFYDHLSWWERHLVDDVLNYFAEMVRTGQNSELILAPVTAERFQLYSSVFCKLLGSVYSNLRAGRFGLLNGLAYQAFFFGARCELDWPDDWTDALGHIVHKRNSAIHTSRVVRFYERNTLIIVKPDRLRHWLPSTAVRDADETLTELREQGF